MAIFHEMIFYRYKFLLETVGKERNILTGCVIKAAHLYCLCLEKKKNVFFYVTSMEAEKDEKRVKNTCTSRVIYIFFMLYGVQ